MSVVLNGKFIVREVLSKTKSAMFGKLKEGDLIEFSVILQRAGGNDGTYATYIRCVNLFDGDETFKSFNQIGNILKHFVLEVC